MALIDLEVRSATELSKTTKDVLDAASAGMVIITREKPNSDIAMLKHDTLKRMSAAHNLVPQVIGIIRYMMAAENESVAPIGPPADLDWLAAYDSEDLRDFSTEYLAVTLRVLQGDLPLSAVDDVLTQWRHSAEVLADDELQQRLRDGRSLIEAS